MLGKGKRHRRVVPKQIIGNPLLQNHIVQKQFSDRFLRRMAESFRHLWNHDVHARLGTHMTFHARYAVRRNWLLNEVDTVIAREPAQEMLRPLVDESPAQ